MAFPGIWGVGRWALSVQVVRARGKEKEEKNKEIGGEQVGRRFLLSWTELTTWYLCIILCKMNSTVRDSASPLQLTDATVGRRWEACSLCLAAPVPSPGPSAWSRHQNLAQHWKFRCAEADRQKTDRHRDKKKVARLQLQPPSEKHDFMYVGRHTSQGPGSRYPRGEGVQHSRSPE